MDEKWKNAFIDIYETVELNILEPRDGWISLNESEWEQLKNRVEPLINELKRGSFNG